MSKLVRICSEAELPEEGQVCEVAFHSMQFCVARSGGEIAVLDNVCPHQEGPLGQGLIESGRVVCPWHAWAFDLKSGQAEHSDNARVKVYKTTIENGALMVELQGL